jgi:hypothetical protein
MPNRNEALSDEALLAIGPNVVLLSREREAREVVVGARAEPAPMEPAEAPYSGNFAADVYAVVSGLAGRPAEQMAWLAEGRRLVVGGVRARG